MSDELADRIEATADYIEQHGWVQYNLVIDDGRVCILGGYQYANGISIDSVADLKEHDPVARVIIEAARCPRLLGYPTEWDIVTEWNDDENRTMQEVLDVLRLAAKMERIADE